MSLTSDDLKKIEKTLEPRFQGIEFRLQQGFEHSVGRAIEEVGRMIKGGFDQMTDEFGRVYQRFDTVDRDVSDIKLRLDQAAYRFELVDLERRVEVLEKRSGLSK